MSAVWKRLLDDLMRAYGQPPAPRDIELEIGTTFDPVQQRITMTANDPSTAAAWRQAAEESMTDRDALQDLHDRVFAVVTHAEAKGISLRDAAKELFPDADERYWDLLAQATARAYPEHLN